MRRTTISSYRLPDGTIPVLLSAESPELLRAEAAALLDYLRERPWVSVDRCSDMLFRVRVARRYRALAMVGERDELLAALRAIADGQDHPRVVSTDQPADESRRAFVFPGQGGQRPGMGLLFHTESPAYRDAVIECDNIFQERFGYSPLSYLLERGREPDDAIDGARVVQPALFTQMIGLAAMWRAAGVLPEAVVGHSQGELAAAVVSGKLTLDDAANIVDARAVAVERITADRYAMAVLDADRAECERLLARRSGWAEVSVVNSARMVGISGERAVIEDIVATLADQGRFSRVIRVGYPAHTSSIGDLRADIAEQTRTRLRASAFGDSEIDCVGSTLGELITAELPVDEYWFWNLRNPVRFDRATEVAHSGGARTFIELSEHPTLALPMRETLAALPEAQRSSVFATSQRTATDLTVFTRNLAAVAVRTLHYPWESLCVEATVTVPLPDFPNVLMDQQLLWLRPERSEHVVTPQDSDGVAVSGGAHAAGRPASGNAPVSNSAPAQLLVERWDRLVRRSLVEPRAFGLVDYTGAAANLATALCAEAEKHGATAKVLEAEDVPSDIDTIVVLVPELPAADAVAAAREVSEFFGSRRWWAKPGACVTEYWLITLGGETVIDGDPAPSPVHAAYSAGFRSVGTEHPEIAFRHLDLAGGADPVPSKILTALHTATEPELALRAGGLYAKRLAELAEPGGRAVRGDYQHVVIVGGTGSVGTAFTEYLVRGGTKRITVVSRSGESAAVTDRLAGIRAIGSTDVQVLACDIGDAAAVDRLAGELAEIPADLVIHAAADFADLTEPELAEITPALVEQALRAKVLGAQYLLDSLRCTMNCRVLLCSSLAATLGGRGTSVYAAANRMVDALARRLHDAGRDCVAVQWGQWDVHQGAGAADTAVLAEVGYLPMASVDAITLGLGAPSPNVVITAFDWERGRAVLGAYGYGPVLAELTTPKRVSHAPVVPASREQVAVEKVATPVPTGGEVSTRIPRLLAEVIGIEDIATIERSRSLVSMGLDSLQALELRRRVAHEFDYQLPVADLISGATLDDVIALARANTAVRATAADTNSAPPSAPSFAVGSGSAESPAHIAAAGGASILDTAQMIERARIGAEAIVPPGLEVNRIRSARTDIDRYGLRAMLAAIAPALEGGAAHTTAEIAERLQCVPRHRWLLRQWLLALTASGCLAKSAEGYRYLRAVPAPERTELAEVCADLGYPQELATFFAAANSNLTALAQDRIRVQELLFADGGTDIAAATYRENLISRYLNRAAREVVAATVSGLATDRSPVRILELGAGVGGTTADVVSGLTDLPVEYHFSDVSDFFLDAARTRFADYPWMRFEILDMNADLVDQPRYDVVIAANVVHNAHHIGTTLRQLRELLNPGGALVFIEACHAHAQMLTSVHFLMSPRAGQPHPGGTDVRAGTDRIFLTEAEWSGQLAAAGLRPLPVLPADDHPLVLLDQRIFTAVRDRES